MISLPLAFRPPEEDTAIEVDPAFPPVRFRAAAHTAAARLPVYLDGVKLIEDDDRHE